MGAVRGALVGALGLIALEAVTRNSDRAAGLIATVAGADPQHPGLVGRALSPAVPLIPDRRPAGWSSNPIDPSHLVNPGLGDLPGLIHNLPFVN